MQRYLQQFDTPMDGILSAIYDVADPKSKVYTRPDKGTTDVDPLAANLEFTGGENAEAVLKWAKNNLSVETNAQIDSKLATAKGELKKTEEGIIQNEEQAIEADQLKLEGRAEDQAIDAADAQENATIARNALEADEAQNIVDKGGSRGNIDNASLEAGLDVDIDIDIEPAREKRARENKRVATAVNKERKPVNKAQRAKDSADENFSRLLANDKLDFTSTNNKKVLTKVAKRNLERAEEFANASNDPEGNLIKLAKFLSERGEGAKRLAKAKAKLDKNKPKKPPTAKQTIVDNIYTKFEGAKGITRKDVAAAFNFVTMDLISSKRIAGAKKYFDTATPEDVKAAAEAYVKSREAGWLLELDVDVAAELDSDVDKKTKTLLKKGDLLGALKEMNKTTSNRRVNQIIRALVGAKEINATNVELVNTKELGDKGYTATTDDSVLAGAYDASTNTIFINTDVPITTHTILHETTHAATTKSLDNPSLPVTKQLQKLFNDLEKDLSSFYGVTNLREFVSEAFSNPEFQNVLSQIDVKGKQYTALQSFFDTITNYIRNKFPSSDGQYKGSALAAIDQAILATLSTSPETRTILTFNNMRLSPTLSQRLENNINKYSVAGSSKQKFLLKVKDFFALPIVTKETSKVFLGSLDSQILGDVARRVGYGQIGYRFHALFEEQRSALKSATEKVDVEIVSFRKWAKSLKSPDLVRQFNVLIYSLDFGATIFDVDPSLSKGQAVLKYKKQQAEDGQYLIDIWSKQQEIWGRLGEEGHKQFKSQRAMYKRQNQSLMDVIYGRIDILTGDNKVLAKTMKARVYRELAARGNRDVYWPLVRDGDYTLSYNTKVKDANGNERVEPVFLMFEEVAERDRVAIEIKNEQQLNPKTTRTVGKVSSSDKGFNSSSWNKAPSGTFVGDVLQLLKDSNVDETTRDEVMRMFISTLPETSFAKSMQGRNTVMGFDPDVDLALRKKGYQLASQITKMQYSAKLNALEDEVTVIAKKGQPLEAKWNENDKSRYRSLFTLTGEEMLNRSKFARQGSESYLDPAAKRANQIAFIWTIGFNTSSAAVNTSQIPLVVIPFLAPKFGFDATWSAFYRAAHSSLSNFNRMDAPYDRKEVRVVNKDGIAITDIQFTVKDSVKKDLYATLDKAETEEERTLLKVEADRQIAELERYIPIVKKASGRGLIKTTIDMDVTGVSSAPNGPRDTSKLKNVAREVFSLTNWSAASAFMFNAAEKFNRQTTLMASYDLILQQLNESSRYNSGLQGGFIDVPKGEVAKAELAAAEAVYITQETNGGAVLETTPRFFREGFGRIAGMYKSFGMRMYSTFTKSLYTALADNSIDYSSPEGKQLRREALQKMAAVSFTSILASGIQGWPLFGLYNMIMNAFDEEDDETFRTSVRATVGELWYKGPLTYYSGVDVSQRVALTNLLLSENRYLSSPTEEELVALYLGGPAWSTAKRWGRGVKDYKEGNIQRAVENFLPAGLTNIYRVIPTGRFYEDKGMYTRAGHPIYAGLTTKEMIMSGLGFPSVRYTMAQEEAAQAKRISVAVGKKRSNLLSKYSNATRTGDYEKVGVANSEIIEFNKKWPNYVISLDSKNTSSSNNIKAAQDYYYGVKLLAPIDAQLRARARRYSKPTPDK